MAPNRFELWSESTSISAEASIVLVGSRGSGKRSLGFIAANKLGRRLITEEGYFQLVTGQSRRQFLQENGNEKFHRQSVEVVRHMLFDNCQNCIIECGLGSLASAAQTLLRGYAKTNPVIYVMRNTKSIAHLLKLDQYAAERMEKIDLTHRSCSNMEYYNLDDDASDPSQEASEDQDRHSPMYSFKLKSVKQEFSAFLDFITGQSLQPLGVESPFSIARIRPESRPYTYAIKVRLSEYISGNLELLETISRSNADVVELVVDIQPSGTLTEIASLVAQLRRHIQAPIIFTVDNKLKSTLSDFSYFDLLHYGVRICVQYVTVDLESRLEHLQRLISLKRHTKVIGDFYDTRLDVEHAWTDGLMLSQYSKGTDLSCDLVRLSRKVTSGTYEDLERFRETISELSENYTRPTLISYNTGTLGHLSQVLNKTFTPVSAVKYSELGAVVKMDPELLTAQEAMQALFWRKVFNPLHFYIVGASVFYSLSPIMHNVAYRVCGMGHDYSMRQSSSLDELYQLAREKNFGGAAISRPFKVGIVSSLTSMSPTASAIGAVNTLIPIRALEKEKTPKSDAMLNHANQRGKSGPVIGWYGDNTDWIGITNCLQKNLPLRHAVTGKTTALIIGAGGMARAAIYAMTRVGCRKIYVFNRTAENADKVARHYNSGINDSSNNQTDKIVEVLRSPDISWPQNRNPPSIIVAAIPTNGVRGGSIADFTIPEHWLTSCSGGVMIELEYKPLSTPLIKQFKKLREAGQQWVIVDGLEVLPEQGSAQFELLTGRKAPREQMRMEILKRYQEDAYSFADDQRIDVGTL